MFTDRTHSVDDLCAQRFSTGSKRFLWDWLLEGGHERCPLQVPALISTTVEATAQLADETGEWEIRFVRVEPAAVETVPFRNGWPRGDRPAEARYPKELPADVAGDGRRVLIDRAEGGG